MPPNAQRGGSSGGGARSGPPRGVQPVLWHLIYAYSQRLRLDPYAVAAVSIAEGGGRFGEVGDGGSSFGPFQLHVGGALPAGQGAGFANSPQGVLYAMQHMAASGAAGLRGLGAIRAIVTRFERPAAPAPEVSRSFATYSGWNGSGGSLPAAYSGGGGRSGAFGAQQQVNFGAQLKAFQQAQSQSLAKALLQQQSQFRQSLANQNQMQLAQNLQAQAQARVAGARTAQQTLNANGLGGGLADSQTILAGEGKSRLDAVRLAALRRAGIS